MKCVDVDTRGKTMKRLIAVIGNAWAQRNAVVLAFVLFLGLGSIAQAFQGYNVVVTTDPVSESAFLSNVGSQLLSSIVPNPFVANTYQIGLFGINPNYNPPITNAQLLQSLVAIGSSTYVYGWADGLDYERWNVLGKFNAQLIQTTDYEVNCSSPTYWGIVAIDSTTCVNMLNKIYNDVYQEFFSTPIAPTVPGPMENTGG